MDRTIRTAHSAFLAARERSRSERADWLDSIAAALEEHRAELVHLAHEESHLSEARLGGELTRTIFQLGLFAAEVRAGAFLDATIDHSDAGWGMGPRPDIRRVNVPLGVVGVFGASNFPFAFSVIGGDSASALAAGCAVVHKIHGAHPRLGRRTLEVVQNALRAAGAPAGLFAGITGRDAGLELVDHPLVQAIGFTGSEQAGRLLFDRACARPRPIPFYGELGSLNPVVVTPAAWEARGEAILEGFAASMTLGLGQFCTKPGLLLLPAAAVEQAAAALPRLLDKPGDTPAMLSEDIRDGFLRSRDGLSGAAEVRTLVQGSDGATGDDLAPRPTVLAVDAAGLTVGSPVLQDEMFGPAAVLVSCASPAEALRVVELLSGQLTGTIHSEPGEDIRELVTALSDRCGRVLRNGWPTGVSVTYAQQHGGPYPAATSTTTSVGTAAARRFLRPVAYQDFADADLPPELQEANPLGVPRRVDGVWEPGR